MGGGRIQSDQLRTPVKRYAALFQHLYREKYREGFIRALCWPRLLPQRLPKDLSEAGWSGRQAPLY